jgi:hypothetical protein
LWAAVAFDMSKVCLTPEQQREIRYSQVRGADLVVVKPFGPILIRSVGHCFLGCKVFALNALEIRRPLRTTRLARRGSLLCSGPKQEDCCRKRGGQKAAECEAKEQKVFVYLTSGARAIFRPRPFKKAKHT